MYSWFQTLFGLCHHQMCIKQTETLKIRFINVHVTPKLKLSITLPQTLFQKSEEYLMNQPCKSADVLIWYRVQRKTHMCHTKQNQWDFSGKIFTTAEKARFTREGKIHAYQLMQGIVQCVHVIVPEGGVTWFGVNCDFWPRCWTNTHSLNYEKVYLFHLLISLIEAYYTDSFKSVYLLIMIFFLLDNKKRFKI